MKDTTDIIVEEVEKQSVAFVMEHFCIYSQPLIETIKIAMMVGANICAREIDKSVKAAKG